jgi:hypothetical protein
VGWLARRNEQPKNKRKNVRKLIETADVDLTNVSARLRQLSRRDWLSMILFGSIVFMDIDESGVPSLGFVESLS